jgi:tRNA (cmo5U34)-methyltransferase
MSDENMKKMESMAEFFNDRADTYEDHMRKDVVAFDRIYGSVCASIPATQSRINILDIGCGTGLELEGIFNKAPNVHIFGIDVSEKMLDKLKTNYRKHLKQITLVCGSFQTYPFRENTYDYALSVWSLHHLLPETKQDLYRKIVKTLKLGGKYIEGDYGVSAEKEKDSLLAYYERTKAWEDARDGDYHLDITLSLDTQVRLLTQAGFTHVEIIWQDGNSAVYLAIR